MYNDNDRKIEWLRWDKKSFGMAESEDKLILLSIVASWCHWCHVMDRTTYANPKVIDIINNRFIPIRVDGDDRPDIRERYLLGGWPTTSFLLPDGRILSGTSYIPSEAMINKLREIDSFYTDQRELAIMHATSLAAEVESVISESEIIIDQPWDKIISDIINAVTNAYDPTYHGFSKEAKFLYPEAIRFAFLQFHLFGNSNMLKIALNTLDAMVNISDPVWGGIYRYSIDRQWSKPHFEKILFIQAEAMINYLDAYQITSNASYGEMAASIESYVNRFLCDKDNGGFYASQDSDINGHIDDVPLIQGESYFNLDENARNAIGIPYVDKSIYTDWNSRMISAYFRLYQVTGDVFAKNFALKTIDRLMVENLEGDHMRHVAGKNYNIGTLADQVYFCIALVDAYQSTGNRDHLSLAEKIVEFIKSDMQDIVQGGYYSTIDDLEAIGHLAERRKPFLENSWLASLYTDLYYLTGNNGYRKDALKTLNAIDYPDMINSVLGSAYGIAAVKMIRRPNRIVIVGSADDHDSIKMLEAGLNAIKSWNLIQLLDPNTDISHIGIPDFTYSGIPAAYIINGDGNIVSTTDVDRLIVLIRDMSEIISM